MGFAHAARKAHPVEKFQHLHRALAAEAGVPPYVIFHDSTLRGIAEARPRTLAELARIQGVGAAKLTRYGEAMLAALAAQADRSDEDAAA